jgi:uncharacterized protein YbaP (TraB family)
MISNNSAIYVRVLFVLLSVAFTQHAIAQKKSKVVENSVFWEVTGNGLSQPSYLFGTFHLLSHRYIDSLTNVTAKFKASKTVVSEMLIDSTMTLKMMASAQMEGTTLNKLLTPEQFKQTNEWLHELSGYDLTMFNSLNPMTIEILLMTMMQQKYFPLDPTKDVVMDLYFQQSATRDKKNVIGLETFEEQTHAVFGQFTYERQAQLLTAAVKERNTAEEELRSMNKLYREGNLSKLEALMYDEIYTPAEAAVMLDNRNQKWMQQLPGLFKQQPTFVAVGAMHLAGENGLVTLLRKQGYTVKPLQAK